MSRLGLNIVIKEKVVILCFFIILAIFVSSCGKTELDKSPRVNIQELNNFQPPSTQELFVQMDIFDSYHKTLYVLNDGRVILYGEFQNSNGKGYEVKTSQIQIDENELKTLKKEVVTDNEFVSLNKNYENDQVPTDIVGVQITVYDNNQSHTSSCTIAFCDEQRYNNVRESIMNLWPEEIEIVGLA